MEPPSLEMFKERLTVANHCCGPVDGSAQSLALRISVRMERTSDSVKKFHKIPPFQGLSTSQRCTKATQVPLIAAILPLGSYRLHLPFLLLGLARKHSSRGSC